MIFLFKCLSLLFLLLACSPKVEKSSISQVCSNVNLLIDPLAQDRVKGLFECKGWNNEYKSLYNGISELKVESWNSLVDPLNKEIFNKSHERSKFIRTFKQLESKEAVANLANWMSMFLDFSPAFKRFFECLNSSVCSEANFSHGEIAELAKSFDLKSEHYISISTVFETLTNYFKKNNKNISIIKSIWGSSFIENIEVELIDAFVSDIIKNENIPIMLNVVKNIFLQKNDNKEILIKKIVNAESLDSAKIKSIILFFTENDKKFLRDIRVVNEVLKKDVVCQINNGKSILSKGLGTEFSEVFEILSTGSYEEFHSLLVEKTFLLTSAKEICPWVDGMEGKITWNGKEEVRKVSLIEMLKKSKELLADPDRYYIVKLVVNAWRGYSGKESTKEVLDNLGENSVEKFVDYSANVFKQHEAAADIIIDYLRSLKRNDLISISHLLDWSSKKEHLILTIAKVWLFLEPEEKVQIIKTTKFILGIDVKAVELLSYFSENFKNLNEVLPATVSRYTARDNFNLLLKGGEDFASILTRPEFKEDFRRFLKDGQLVTFIHLISQNSQFTDLHDLQFGYLEEYYERNKIPGFVFGLEQTSSKSQESQNQLECINALAEQSVTFNALASSLPKSCRDIQGDNTLINIFKDLNNFGLKYSQESPNANAGHLFDELGFVNKRSFSQMIALLKVIDGYKEEGYLKELLNNLGFLLIDYKFKNTENINTQGAVVFDSMLGKLSDIFLEKQNNTIQENWRNKLIFEFSKNENFELVGKALLPISQVLQDYGSWKNSQDFNEFNSRVKPFDAKFSCENYQNIKLSPFVCPEKQELKKRLNEIIKLFARVNDERGLTGAGEFFEAVSVGISIPYESKFSKRKKLTTRETLEMVYDLTDESYPLNKITIPFKHLGTDSKNNNSEKMNTLERVETVIREVGFDKNYLGVNFKNSVTRGDDYVAAIERKKNLFKNCIKLGFCGRFINSDEKRMALNAIASIDSLIEASSVFGFGDYNQALLSIFVSSSWSEAQGGSLGDAFYSNEKLARHNGIILTKMAELGTFVNIARVIRDRVGRTKDEFKKFIQSKQLNMISGSLFRGFDLIKSKEIIKNLVNILYKTKSVTNNTINDEFIDWISSLEYDELRLAEETLSSVLTISSYLGSVEQVGMGKHANSVEFKEFEGNNLFKTFASSVSILELWKTLHSTFPKKYELIGFLKYINNFLYFYKEQLLSQDNLANNPYYLSLNYFFKGFQSIYFEEFESGTSTHKTMLDIIKDHKLDKSFYGLIANMGIYIQEIENFDKQNQILAGTRFINAGKFLEYLSLNKVIDLSSLRDYLLLTTKKQVCDESKKCFANNHYDEPAKLLRFLTNKVQDKSRFYIFQEYLLKDKKDPIADLLDKVFGILEVHSN